MDTDFITRNWALFGAAVPALIVLIIALRTLLARTADSQLRRVVRDHRESLKTLVGARKASEKCQVRIEKLTSISGSTKPRILQEARESADDAMSLVKIAADKILVTANHVRRIIHEEFPPDRQQRLRDKYLPQDEDDGRPYSFQ